ncbi:MAG: PAS domain-containing protein [Verrucomicrobiae bacterium]|nr:PAS domain-containing protein [Verrucomicrobiae bacterium]
MKSAFLEKLLGRIDKVDEKLLRGVIERLVREKGFLETIFNALQEGVMVVDGQGQVIYYNQAATDLVGVRGGPSNMPNLREILDDMQWDEFFQASRAGPNAATRLLRREVEILQPKRRFVELYLTPIAADDEEPKYAVLILRDITDKRVEAAQALESERVNAIMMLAADVAHEIGNPLNSLHIHLQLMERDLKKLPASSREKLGQSIHIAKEEVSRLDSIVTQFLGAIRPAPLQPKPASVNDVLRQVIEFMSQEIENRGVSVQVNFAGNLPATLLDVDQTKQAFFNLFKNSLQAMTRGGKLAIETQGFEDKVVVTLSDTGKGIDAPTLKKIFEPYYTTKEKGTGLGLFIVDRIVRQHGGWIEVSSREGKGTTFRITIPSSEKRIRMLEVHG